MPESGGPTTESGILYQNSIAALYLGRMLDPRSRPNSERPVEVRVEAPTNVDDTVVCFVDGHRRFIQVKERIDASSEAWKKLWDDFEQQRFHANFGEHDWLVLRFGEDNDASKSLRDSCKQAEGATNYDEWYKGLSKVKKGQVQKVRDLLRKQDGGPTLFALLQCVNVESARSLEEIERDLVSLWMPEVQDQVALFRILRDLCGGNARYRKVFTPDSLLKALPDSTVDELKALAMRVGLSRDGPLSPLGIATAEDTYRQQLVSAFGRLGFGGFERGDPWLAEVPLEKVFIHLSLTVEKKVVRQREDGKFRLGIADHGIGRRGDAEQEIGEQERVETIQEPVTLAGALRKNVLIVGEPGAGKSTLLRWLAVTFAQERQREEERLDPQAETGRLPMLLELGRLPKEYLSSDSHKTPDWLAFLPEEVCRQLSTRQVPVTDIPPGFFQHALAEGSCLLLFDGLDEVMDRSARRRLAASLADFGQHHAKHRVVIASRPAGVSEAESVLATNFQRCQIERFAKDQVREFFRFWYSLEDGRTATEPQVEADTLFDQLQTMPGALELATTPLLATMLLIIWRNEGRLPSRRVELYERCCKQLIENWEAGHDVADQGVLADLGWERHLRLLTPVAHAIHNKGHDTRVTKQELTPVLAGALQQQGLCEDETRAHLEAEKYLDSLGLRSGLLQVAGGGQYAFPHLTFQEYLAALYIGDKPYPDYIDLFMEHLHVGTWREVHLMTIGHLGSNKEGGEKASRLIQAILSVYPPPSSLLLPKGNVLLSRFDAGRYLPWVQRQRRIAWLLGRELALAVSGFAESRVDTIDQTTQDLLDAQAARYIKESLRRDDRRQVLNDFVKALGQGTPAVVQALLAALGDSDRDVRRAAASSLGQLGQTTPVVVQALLAALGDSSWFVQDAAASSLGQLGQTSPAVMQALLTALGDFDLRAAAASSLGRLGQGTPVVVQALLAALGDGSSFVRDAAASSLGQLGQGTLAVVQALLATLGDSDGDVRRAAASSLGQLGQGTPAVVQALLAALGDRFWFVQAAAASSLGQLGQATPAVVQALLAALGDRDGNVRGAAASSLGRLGQGTPVVVQALLAALGDRDEDVRNAAAASLGQLRQATPVAMQALLADLGNSSWFVRAAAAASLGRLGQTRPAVVEALLAALGDSSLTVRAAAASSLGQLGQTSPEIIKEETVSSVLVYLVRDMHKVRPQISHPLADARRWVEGRPLPRYRWMPIRDRQARHRRFLQVVFWIGLAVLIALIAMVGAWLMGQADPNGWLARFIAVLAAIVAFGAAVAGLLGWRLRYPWKAE